MRTAFELERYGGRCYVRPSLPDLEGGTVTLRDLMNPTIRSEQDGGDLARRGLYLDLPAWGTACSTWRRETAGDG